MQTAARPTSLLRAAFFASAVALALGACTKSERQEVRTEAKQATNAAANVVDNAALTTKVKAALLADELVKGTQINVDSNSGVVTLNGGVDTAAHIQRAEQVARGVSGVTRVQNNLTAPPPVMAKPSPDMSGATPPPMKSPSSAPTAADKKP